MNLVIINLYQRLAEHFGCSEQECREAFYNYNALDLLELVNPIQAENEYVDLDFSAPQSPIMLGGSH